MEPVQLLRHLQQKYHNMKGLQSRFYLKNGKFVLTEGIEKSRDSIWFYCIFDKFRVYTLDFGANFVSLVQKPTSYLIMNSTLILGTLRQGIQKYVPNVTIKNVDIGYFSTDRKNYHLMVEYNSIQENKEEIQDVTFV